MTNPMAAPQCFYRVSVKALIRNQAGELAFVKEGRSGWTLPGGGIDHGESVGEALRRELQEELGVELVSYSPDPVMVQITHHPKPGYYSMRLIYEAEVKSLDFTPTIHVSETVFMSADALEHGEIDTVYDDTKAEIIAYLRADLPTASAR